MIPICKSVTMIYIEKRGKERKSKNVKRTKKKLGQIGHKTDRSNTGLVHYIYFDVGLKSQLDSR